MRNTGKGNISSSWQEAVMQGFYQAVKYSPYKQFNLTHLSEKVYMFDMIVCMVSLYHSVLSN